MSTQFAMSLADLDSPMKNKYWRTADCGTDIIQKGNELKSKYCGCRWCMVCNRIRTGKLINKYLELSTHLQDAHFVTLTVRNMSAVNVQDNRTDIMRDVRWMQRKMFKHFRKIQDVLRKDGVKIKGIRSYECIPTKQSDGIRPHIHWKIDGTIDLNVLEKIWYKQKLPKGKLADLFFRLEKKEITPGFIKGELLVQLWLKEFKGITDRKGQDVQPCKPGSEMELFKYETKLIVRNKHSENKIPLRLLDVIYEATQSVRCLSITGFIQRKPKQPKELTDESLKRYKEQLAEFTLYKTLTGALEENINDNLQAEKVEDIAQVETVYRWMQDNWYDITTGQPLIKFEITIRMAKFIECFSYG